MERIVQKIKFPAPQTQKLTRVAAYARVSSGKDAMLHSLSAQVSYYNDLIQARPGWVFCGVYADEALTGTKDNRENFQRLLADCRGGGIDMVITKSISRFARNTVTLLETVRELKDLGVDVFFEEQNIHSISADGELMLTILASYAQEESCSASENQKWRVRRNFENGCPWNGTVLGYRIRDSHYEVIPEEAKIVKRIFADYLGGFGFAAIAQKLNEEGIPSPRGIQWSFSTVHRILKNYSYTGNLLLQQTFSENHLTKKMRPNRGELPQYHAADTHEAIISMEDYMAVQVEMEKRAAKHYHPHPQQVYPFSGIITCAHCGKHYKRKVTAGGPVWICRTYSSMGKAACPSKQIPEDILTATALEVGGITESKAIPDKITAILAKDNNELVFTLASGEVAVKRWADRSRRESWTDEMKAAARQRALERRHEK